MKIQLKNTADQVELIKMLGSKDRVKSAEAAEAFAAAVGSTVQSVLSHAGTASMIYTDAPYGEDESPSFPVDTLFDKSENYIQVWSQHMAGGLPTSHPEGVGELKFSTFTIDSAVSFLKKWARKSRLDVVASYLDRMSQEMLIKQERNAWAVVLKCLAEASTKDGKHSTASGSVKHVIRANTAGRFQLQDLNELLIRVKRVNVSWANGTPAGGSVGLTDLFVSPEVMGDIRGFAYQPMNTVAGVTGSTGTPAGSTVGIPLPDDVRSAIFRGAGTMSIFDKFLTELVELGQGAKYNTLFDDLAGATSWTKLDGSGGAAFDGGSSGDELIVGLDLTRGTFLRPVEVGENGGQVQVLPDNQWVDRSDKVGFYAHLQEGRVALDARAVSGIVL